MGYSEMEAIESFKDKIAGYVEFIRSAPADGCL